MDGNHRFELDGGDYVNVQIKPMTSTLSEHIDLLVGRPLSDDELVDVYNTRDNPEAQLNIILKFFNSPFTREEFLRFLYDMSDNLPPELAKHVRELSR